MSRDATAAGLRWVPDPHNAGTIDLREAGGRLRGWIAPVLGKWRAVISGRLFLSKPPDAPPPFTDPPTEAAARQWVERTVAAMMAGGHSYDLSASLSASGALNMER